MAIPKNKMGSGRGWITRSNRKPTKAQIRRQLAVRDRIVAETADIRERAGRPPFQDSPRVAALRRQVAGTAAPSPTDIRKKLEAARRSAEKLERELELVAA